MDRPMLNCPKCGTEFNPADKFCKKCGTLVPSDVNIPGLKPVKRARLNWLPWVVALVTAFAVLYFGGMLALYKYREYTGYYDNLHRLQAEEKVKVTDDRNRTVVYEPTGERVRFRYPRVSITLKNRNKKHTTKFDDEIEPDLEKYYDGKHAANYVYYINDNVLSVIVEVRRLGENPRSDYFVYNFSLETGRMLEAETMILKNTKITDKQFFKMVKETYNSYFETADLTEKEKSIMLDRVSYEYVEPYFGERGHICFAAEIEKEDGSHEMAIFDAETQKRLTGPLDSK